MEKIEELVKKAKKGDSQAFAKLYQEIYMDLYRFALYILKNPQDAEDVVGDVVVSAFEQIGKLRKEEAFRGWMFRILTNRCKRKLKEYVSKTVELTEGMIGNHKGMTEDIQVRMAFAKLTDEERMIISMHVFAGYSSKETGHILHMSHNTVRSKESRALKKMESFMQE